MSYQRKHALKAVHDGVELSVGRALTLLNVIGPLLHTRHIHNGSAMMTRSPHVYENPAVLTSRDHAKAKGVDRREAAEWLCDSI